MPPRVAPRVVPSGRPRIGLALSGGGARGAAHVGVLKALEELHVPIDFVAGTSMGSIVGGLYASGMSPAQIEEVFQRADWRYLLSDAPPRESQPLRSRQRDFDLDQNIRFGISEKGELKLPAGLVAGRKLLVNLREQTLPVRTIDDFDRLPIPFRAVATDLETGDKVVIGHGNLAEAMRASMAVPGVFTPYRIGDHLCVDGGLSSNLPIETVRQMGADIIIAVDVSAVLLKEKDLGSAFAVTNQMLDIYIKQATQREVKTLGRRDVYIHLPLEGATSINFLGAADNIPSGYREAMKHAAELRPLADSPADYRRLTNARRVSRSTTAADISFVKIDSPSGPVRQELKEKIPFKPGERVEFSDLNSHLVGLEGLRGYEVTDFDVIEENGQLGLNLKARKRTDGPNFLHVGADFNYGTPGVTDANLRLEWRMTELNRLGAEWDTLLSIGDQTRVYTEFYQPIVPQGEFFLAPFAYYNSELIDARDADDSRRRFRLQDLRAGLDAGIRLGQAGELRLGYAYGLSDLSRVLNLPEGSADSASRGEAHAILSIDTLDRSGFPTKGWFTRAEGIFSNRMLGARDDYGRLDAEVFKPLTFGKNTFVPRATAGVRVGGDSLPFYDRPSLGGFLNLSGLTRRDLYDQNALLAELIYYREIAKLPPGLGSGIYGGASIEAGNVWGSLSDASPEDAVVGGSLFLGADSILGPLSLGVGASGDGHTAVYLQLGPAFGRGRLDR